MYKASVYTLVTASAIPFGKRDAQLSLGKATAPSIFEGQRPTSGRGEKAITLKRLPFHRRYTLTLLWETLVANSVTQVFLAGGFAQLLHLSFPPGKVYVCPKADNL